jgi:hypothetical protein
VETHLAHIFAKLDVSSRTEAAIYAIESGLLSMPKFMESTDNENDNYYYEVIR